MIVDRYGSEHATTNTAAIVAFEDAVFAVAAHRPAGEHLTAALTDDPGLTAAHALMSLGVILLGKAEDIDAGRAALPKARSALARSGGGTAFEAALVEALALATRGLYRRAAARLEAHLETAPRAFLILKLANALRFLSGQPETMMRTTTNALSSWSPQMPAYGFVLGMHAFGLEECGALEEAEQLGRLAVRHQPEDTWAIHAVGHVLEMRGRTDDGARWMQSSRELWPSCNNFGYHLAWHLALFELEAGRYDSVLALYDSEVRPTQTDDFRDMSNAVSLLWRLEQEGVDVGDRWEGLQNIAHRRREDTTNIFASLHYLLALIASGNQQAAREVVDAMDAAGSVREDDQAVVARNVGLDVASAIVGLPSSYGVGASQLDDLAIKLPAIGGSHAQRDVFMRTLMDIAARAGDIRSLDALTKVRASLRSEDRFDRLINDRVRPNRPADIADAMPQIMAH